MITTSWIAEDPRVHFDKAKGTKVIVWTGRAAAMGLVENHHAWSIELIPGVPGRRGGDADLITSEEDWPEGWLWCLPPVTP